MAVQDLWVKRDGTRSARYGRGKRWRVSHPIFTTKAFDDRREADLYWAECLREAKRAPRPVVTVGGLLDLWLATKAGQAESTIKACQVTARSLRPHWADIPADAVMQHEIQAFLASMTASPSRTVTRPASVSVRRKALQALSGALAIAVDIGAITTNPAAAVEVRKGQPRRRWYLRPAQLLHLAELASEIAGIQDAGTQMLLMGTAGPRISETVALNVGDVQQDRRRVSVWQSKTRASREVPISTELLGLLNLDRPSEAPLFLSPQGTRVSPGNWRRRIFHRAAQRAGFIGIVPHDLRHTTASIAIAAGADVKVVQRMLGHASAAMTLDLYGHLWDERLGDVGDLIGATMWPEAEASSSAEA